MKMNKLYWLGYIVGVLLGMCIGVDMCLKDIHNQINAAYEDGFHTGVNCRSILSTSSCELLLEKSKE
jgi:hypothetical protein